MVMFSRNEINKECNVFKGIPHFIAYNQIDRGWSWYYVYLSQTLRYSYSEPLTC
jgi:hypothetical protein